jgi:mRNA-degrading endonuclease RelE of RelBE toxin-antitoxin system
VTPFTVEWLSSATQELAKIWLNAQDRKAVTAADALLDRLLSRDPFGYGRLLSEDLYQIHESPLTVFFEVDVTQRRVIVTRVWFTP